MKSQLRPGEATELIASLSNTGNSTESSITLDFVMPTGFSGDGSEVNPPITRGFGTLIPGELVGWDIPSLAPGQIVHRRIMVVAQSGASALPNGTSAGFDFIADIGGIQNDTFTRSLTVHDSHDLDAAFALETAGAVDGKPFAVTIAYGNRGTNPQGNLSIELELPPSTSLAEASSPPAVSGSTLIWSGGTLDPGSTGQIQLRLVSSGSPAAGELRELALTASTSTRTQSAQATLAPGTAAGLQVSLDHSQLPIAPGNPVQITAALTNSRSFATGNSALVALTPDRISGEASWADEPPGLGFSNLSTGEVFGWNPGALAARNTVQARFQFWPAAGVPAGSVIPLVMTGSDDSGAQAFSMIAIPIHGNADLNLEFASDDASFEPGQDTSFALTIANRSTTPLTNVRPRVTLPAAILRDLAITGGNATLSGDVLEFSPISIGPRDSVEMVITGRVDASLVAAVRAAGSLAESLTAFADTSSSAHTTALASLTRTVRDHRPIDLRICADRSIIEDAGSDSDAVRVFLTVTNRSSFPLSNLVLDALLPEDVIGDVSWMLPSPARGFSNLSPTELFGWNLPTLEPGASYTHEMLLYANAPAGAGSVVALKARVRDSARTMLDDAQLNLTLAGDTTPEVLVSADKTPAGPGETVRFTVYYGNPTASSLSASQLVVALPRGLEFLFGDSGLVHTPDAIIPGEGGGTLTMLSGAPLAPGSNGQAVFYAAVRGEVPVGAQLPVAARLLAGGRRATSCLDLPVSNPSNLELSISQDGLPLTSGSRAGFVFSVTNRSQFDLNDVAVRFLFPGDSSGAISTTSPVADVGFSNLTEAETTGWNIPLLPAGSTHFLRCMIEEDTAPDGLVPSLVARATAADGSLALAHSAVTFDSDAKLDLSLSAGPHATLPGSETSLEIAFGNRSSGPIGSTGFRLDLPGDLLEVVAPAGNPPLVGNAMLWNRTSLAPGDTGRIPVIVRWRPGVPVGSQATITARATSSDGPVFAAVTLAATHAFQAEMVPSIAISDGNPSNGQTIDITLSPENTSGFPRTNVTTDFFVNRGMSGNVSNANPPVAFGFSNLDFNERIGWTFVSLAAAANPVLVQPATFSVGTDSPAGSVIPLSAAVFDGTQGHNLASLSILSAPGGSVALTPVDPLGSDPNDLDDDGIPDIYESGTGVFVSIYDAGTDPNEPDSDNDGLLDGAELASGFFDPNKDDSEIVSFFEQRTRDLAMGAPVINRNQSTGEVALKIGLRESGDLSGFAKRPILPDEVSIEDGEIQVEFETNADVFFYRFLGRE